MRIELDKYDFSFNVGDDYQYRIEFDEASLTQIDKIKFICNSLEIDEEMELLDGIYNYHFLNEITKDYTPNVYTYDLEITTNDNQIVSVTKVNGSKLTFRVEKRNNPSVEE